MFAARRTIGEKLYAGMMVLLLLTVVEGGVAPVELGAGRGGHQAGHPALGRAAAHDRDLHLAVQDRKQRQEHAVGGSRQRPAAVRRREEGEPRRVRHPPARASTRWPRRSRSTSDRQLAATLRQKLDEWKTLHAQIVELGDSGRVAEALETLSTKATPLFRSAEDSARSIAELMFKATDDATLSLSQSRAGTLTAIVIVIALIVGTLVGYGWSGTSTAACASMSRELGEGGQLVVEASSQMSVSAQSMSQGAAEQAASLEETSASMEEMAAMTRQNAENSQQAAGADGARSTRASTQSQPGARRDGRRR